MKLKKYWKQLLIFTISKIVILAIIIALSKSEKPLIFLKFLELQIKENYFSSVFILGLLIVLTCFPPIIGHGIITVFIGYVFGIVKGFFITYSFTLIGATLCFLMFRYVVPNLLEKIVKRYEKFNIVNKVIDKGLKVLILLMFSYPHYLMNSLLAFTNVKYSKFILATAISNLKLLLQVMIGSSLKDLNEIVNGKSNPLHYISIGVGILFFVICNVYIWYITKKILKENEIDNEIEKNEKGENIEIEIIKY